MDVHRAAQDPHTHLERAFGIISAMDANVTVSGFSVPIRGLDGGVRLQLFDWDDPETTAAAIKGVIAVLV